MQGQTLGVDVLLIVAVLMPPVFDSTLCMDPGSRLKAGAVAKKDRYLLKSMLAASRSHGAKIYSGM